MPERLLNIIPFLMITGEGKHRLNTTRIIEAIIISIIGGAFSGYIAMLKMQVQMEDLKTNVQHVEAKVDKVYNDIYRPFIPRSK